MTSQTDRFCFRRCPIESEYLGDYSILDLFLEVLHAGEGRAADQVLPQISRGLKLRVVLAHKVVIKLRGRGSDHAAGQALQLQQEQVQTISSNQQHALVSVIHTRQSSRVIPVDQYVDRGLASAC